MAIRYVPGPNNEMIPVSPPDTSSRFPINGDFATSASYSSFADSASYAVTSSHTVITTQSVVSSSFSTLASTASYVSALTSVQLTGSNNASGYIFAARTSSISTPTVIDSFSSSVGNTGKWLISINDGASFGSSEVMVIWDVGSNSVNFTETTTNSIGNISVSFSVDLSGGRVRLIANPSNGNWDIKMLRFFI